MTPILVRARDTMIHRGPDEQALYRKDRIGIGFNRLSIVDEGGGMQPLYNEDRSIAVVCNGEIYNSTDLRPALEKSGHTLSTHSDCEPIAHLYENDPHGYTARLDGMFAYVLADHRRNLVHLGRDRLGIKPLFIYEDARVLVAASEIKAILATGLAPREFDRQAIADYFVFRYVPGIATIFRGISHLPPGAVLEINLNSGSSSIREYWSPEFPEAENRLVRVGPHAARLRSAFEQSVNSHTLSDRPVGAYLSGGIDSSVTAAILAKTSAYAQSKNPLDVFSIAFPGQPYDESPVFEKTVRDLGFNLHAEAIESVSAEDFKRCLYYLEQPQCQPLDIPMYRLSKLVRASGFKVVLSGEGSDELFGGYSVYGLNQIRRALNLPGLRGFKAAVLPRLMSQMIRYPDDQLVFLKVFTSGDKKIIDRFGTFPVWLPMWMINSMAASRLLADPVQDSLGEGSAIHRLAEPLKGRYSGIDEFNKSIYLELKTRLPNYILARADRNSMANSVELRVPFLSNKMIDTTCSIPTTVKMLGVNEKYVLRKAFRRYIPRHIYKRKKFGYIMEPGKLWAGDPPLIREMMSEAQIKKTGLFNPQTVNSMLAEFRAGADESRVDKLGSILTGVLSIQLLDTVL